MATPTVTISQGKLNGKRMKNYDGEEFFSFQGIPFVKSPVGDLRFCPPQPPEPWTGTFDATKEGPECPSSHMLIGTHVGEEDNCLNLNVYTKNLPEEGKNLLPVMVWIHGGAFVIGSNRTSFYGPEFLLTEDIVLVTINYRLGPLGFLSLEDSSLGVTGNAGLKDQVMALKWVQQNIKNFNGDPNNVTIFGESAGGASVHYLILSPLAKGLFHKAIMQSGVALNPWAIAKKGPQELCEKLNYKETDEKKILEYLRTLPARQFTTARMKSRDSLRAGQLRHHGPVIEDPHPGAFLTDTPENIIKSGNYNKVPMIVGYTDKEAFLFDLVRRLIPHADYPIKNFEKEIDFRLKFDSDEDRTKVAEKVRKFYFGDDPKAVDDIEKTVTLKTDTCWLNGIYRGCRLHLSTTNQPIYLYEMSLETELNVCKRMFTTNWTKLHVALLYFYTLFGEGYLKKCYNNILKSFSCTSIKGAAHGDELLYLFNGYIRPVMKRDSEEELWTRRFVKLWTNFAKYGNPTPDGEDQLMDIKWPTTDKDLTYLEIAKEPKIGKSPNEERRKFWDEIFDKYYK